MNNNQLSKLVDNLKNKTKKIEAQARTTKNNEIQTNFC